MVNSHLLFKLVTGSRISQLDFRVAVAKSLTEGLEHPRPSRSAGSRELPVRLTERSFPVTVPEGKRPDCVVCSNRGVGQRHQMGYRCKVCHIPLCLYPCFEHYHTLKDYKVKVTIKYTYNIYFLYCYCYALPLLSLINQHLFMYGMLPHSSAAKISTYTQE